MASQKEHPFFEDARKNGQPVVSDPPKLDLESYIANYKGRTRFNRLFHIANTSSYLYLEALKAAVAEARAGKDVHLYQMAVTRLFEVAPDEPEATLDKTWVDRTAREVKAETGRLEQELKGYKNNLIKESIRMGYDDLGRHYHQIGALSEATKAYTKEREFCQLPSHVAIMIFRLISVFVDQGSWLNVETNVQKLRHLAQKPAELEKAEPKLCAALGLAQMSSRKYADAAHSFLSCDPRMLQARLDDPTDEESYNEVVTPNDIATYGALCALASMDRTNLQVQVLDNSKFRSYLELEPHLRRAISSFVSGKYAATLSILESYRPDYLLDLHLSKHYQELFNRIRSKALVQYFAPFSCLTLSALASAFSTDEASLETSIVDLIRSGSLNARLDLEKRTLLANRVDDRSKVHQEALATAKEYERTAQLRILRMEVHNSGLEVKAPKAHGLQPSMQGSQGDLDGDTLMGGDLKGKGLRSGSRYS